MSFLRTLLENLPPDMYEGNPLDMTPDELDILVERVVKKAQEQEKKRLDSMVEMDDDLFKIE